MEDPLSEAREARELIRHCLSGQPDAVKQFQQRYGELIYGYPIRVYRTPAEDAGDFYIFAFQEGRIFRRLRTYEGRAPLRAYLLGFVLDDLVLEWKRGEHKIETVSIEGLGELPAAAASAGQAPVESAAPGAAHPSLNEMLETVAPSKAVMMKLLYVEDCELRAPDIDYLAEVSGRTVPQILDGLARLRATVREREAGLKKVEDGLDAVQAWIQLYERRQQRISEDLAALPQDSSAAERLREELAQLEHKVERRQQQRSRLLAQAHRRKVTAPYKDIAALLNTTIGNVCSQIARIRRELMLKAGAGDDTFGVAKREAKGVGSA
jgi:predicted transcriptional regulator